MLRPLSSTLAPTLAPTLALLGACASSGAALAAQTDAPTSADEVRAIVAEMISDAEGRSSLLQSGATAGHDGGGFFLSSADGAFNLQVKGFMQFRYALNFRPDNTAGDDFTPGFSAPRTVMFFKGKIHEDIGYQIRFNFSAATGAAGLDDAFVTFKLGDGWSLRLGQGLHAFDREWHHGDVKLQTIERSPVAYLLGGFRSQGAMFTYSADDFRLFLTFSDGLRSQNTDLGASPADYAFTARGEFKLSGDWNSVSGPLTSPRGSEEAFALGGAVHYESGPDLNIGGTEQSLFAWTADLNYKNDGWNVFATATGYHVSDEAGVPGADFDDFGFVLQGGYYIADNTELFGRYSVILPDSAPAPADDNFNAIALGVNWYLHGHAARFTLQGELFLDPTTTTVAGNFANTGGRTPASSLFGILADDHDNQFTLMAQFQLLF